MIYSIFLFRALFYPKTCKLQTVKTTDFECGFMNRSTVYLFSCVFFSMFMNHPPAWILDTGYRILDTGQRIGTQFFTFEFFYCLAPPMSQVAGASRAHYLSSGCQNKYPIQSPSGTTRILITGQLEILVRIYLQQHRIDYNGQYL